MVEGRMIGEAARLTAGCGNHEDIQVAVVVAGVSDPLAVRREVRVDLGAGTCGEPLRIATLAADGPNIAGIGEGDLVAADRGVADQQRSFLGPR
jgi:hypothetical protein